MTNKFKPGDKVWVKARYEADAKDDETECIVVVNEHEDGDWMDAHDVRVRRSDIRPRAKRKSPWQPIETAPKDGTWILVACASRRPDEDSYPASVARWGKGYLLNGGWGERWCVDGNVDLGWYPEPTHWMPIPEVE